MVYEVVVTVVRMFIIQVIITIQDILALITHDTITAHLTAITPTHTLVHGLDLGFIGK